MDVSETIKILTKESKFVWGLETVMQILRPNCLYQISVIDGNFELTEWPEYQWDDVKKEYIKPPSIEEIKEEYIRQKTISECIEYFKQNPA